MKKIIALLLFPLSLYAGTYPEPMVYDLMRGLDARQGELEFNTLYLANGDYSPEIEYAVKDGWALELETPVKRNEVESLKWGTQYTLATSENSMIGLQAMMEDYLHQSRSDLSLTLIVNLKLSDYWFFTGIGGIRSAVESRRLDHHVSVLNASLFYKIHDKLALGLEHDENVYFVDKQMHLHTIPQVSYRINPNIKFQAGVGLDWQDSNKITGIVRGILNF